MTLDDARAVFAANNGATESPGSFMEALHEQSRFDRDAFWQLYNALMILNESEDCGSPELRESALHLYDYALQNFVFHLSPHHRDEIADCPGEDLYLYMERMRFAFTGVIRGRRTYAWDIDNDLPNPRRPELEDYFRRRGMQ